MNWELVTSSEGVKVRRLEVPGGWLYQVELVTYHTGSHYNSNTETEMGWHDPVFVPCVAKAE